MTLRAREMLLLRLARLRIIRRHFGPLATWLDAILLDMTGCRISLIGRPRIPMLVLTTTGRRTNRPRRVALVYHDEGGAWYVVGSNWGKPEPPQWALNLLEKPRACVKTRVWSGFIKAVVLGEDARQDIWPRLLETMPAWKSSRTARTFLVFALLREAESASLPTGP